MFVVFLTTPPTCFEAVCKGTTSSTIEDDDEDEDASHHNNQKEENWKWERERSSTSVVRAYQLVRKSTNEWLSSTSEIQCWDLTHYCWLDFLCLELMEAVHKIADIVILKNCKSISKLTFVTTLLPFGFFHWLGTMLWASIWTKRWALLRTQFLLVFLSSVNSF